MLEELCNGKKFYNRAGRESGMLRTLSQEEGARLKKTLMEMYQDIRRVCEKNKIRFFLAYGSALGAVRHKGFIPWDDDLDLCMYRGDYNKFVSVFERELGKKYILNAPNYCKNAKARFPKVLLKGAHLKEIFDPEDEGLQCAAIDIFLIDRVPSSPMARTLKGIYCNMLEFMQGQVLYYERLDNRTVREIFTRAGCLNYYFRVFLGFLFHFKSSSQWCDCIDRAVQYHGRKAAFYGCLTGRGHYFGEWFQKEDIFPAAYGEFEGVRVPLFHHTDLYLRRLYGDYMELPPVEGREKHYLLEFKL